MDKESNEPVLINLKVAKVQRLTPDLDQCYKTIRRHRFGRTVSCVYCGATEQVINKGTTSKGAQQYRCKKCETYFNDLTGTFFENRKFPTEEMFFMIREMGSRPTTEIASELDRDYEAVLNFRHDLEELCNNLSIVPDKVEELTLESFLRYEKYHNTVDEYDM